MSFKKISTKTLKQIFITEMETMILSEELKIGEKLPPERDIAHKMQISRSVVNDGIAALSKMGFLTIIPRYGTYVADYKSHGTIDILVAIMKNGNVSNEYIRSTLELRQQFMRFALEKIIPIITKEQIQCLRDICQKFNDETSCHKGAEFIYQFDDLLMKYSGNLLLPILFSSFSVPNKLLLENYLENNGMKLMNDRNLNLLEAIEQKNINKATEIIDHVLNEAIHGTTNIYKENPAG